ncbi:hypothetical protein TEA_024635 [Camellia sinensis var. sinensis]|uniref:USP domain-containing protein n=1 Tax=Camellia sinensis var. sinensis TaxID=542762 RepID=A0A4S4EVD6_CAMSN|nr:hypothetical protein TEA_024635 [Camellia sinensis var. sinensis]
MCRGLGPHVRERAACAGSEAAHADFRGKLGQHTAIYAGAGRAARAGLGAARAGHVPHMRDDWQSEIPVPLFNILKKFDGESVTEVVRPRIARMRYRVTRLPQYLILHMRRFTKNNFFVEKNPTLVNFPVKNLELKDYIPLPTPKENEKLRSKYDLIANIVHDGKPGEGSYRVFVQRKSEELWYEMQDLHVSETLPQMVALSEAYMQIYEQHK